jgi:hypothetical protein
MIVYYAVPLRGTAMAPIQVKEQRGNPTARPTKEDRKKEAKKVEDITSASSALMSPGLSRVQPQLNLIVLMEGNRMLNKDPTKRSDLPSFHSSQTSSKTRKPFCSAF